ncbi:MAG: O-antigen ligase family protein [Anaerolineae bacterium]
MSNKPDAPATGPAWPWASLPAGQTWGKLGLAALVIAAGWALARLPLGLAATLVVALIVGVGILLRPALGLVLLAFAIPFGSLRSLPVGGMNLGPQDVLLAAVAASWLLRQVAHRQMTWRWPMLGGTGLLLLGVMMFSLLPASSLGSAFKEIIKWAELWVAMVLVLNVADEADVWLLAIALLVAGAAEAIVGIGQIARGRGPEAFMILGSVMRASGTFDQPNPFGGYMGLVLPLAVALLMTTWPGRGEAARRRQILLWLVAAGSAVLLACGLYASWSRGAWLGAAAALAVVLVARGGRWLRGLTIGGVFVVALSVVVFGRLPLPGGLQQRFVDYAADLTTIDVRAVEITDANFSVVERAAHWQAALAMIADHPWTGVGIGNYAAAYERYALPRWRDPLGHAHNYYLNIAAEAGLPGLAAYLLWVVAGIWVALRAARIAPGWYLGLALGALGLLTHLCVHSLFDNLYVHGMAIHVGLVLGLAAWVAACGGPQRGVCSLGGALWQMG